MAVLVPTAHGALEFPGLPVRTAKYAIFNQKNQNFQDIYTFLINKSDEGVAWNIDPPSLIVSVTGGAEHFSVCKPLLKVFKKGLMKVAETAGAWIISGGTDYGVMKQVGKAVKQHSSAEPDKKVVSLGIVLLNHLCKKEELKNNTEHNTIVCIPGVKCTKLDKNHTHFIMLDDDDADFYDEIKFRVGLEKQIATSIGEGVLNEQDGPNHALICYVLLQGGLGALETVCKALEKGTPVVVVAGSGQCANILAELDKGNMNSDSDEEIKKLLHDEGMQIELEKFDNNKAKWKECFKIWQKLSAEERKKLITFYQWDAAHGEKELDVAILESIIQATPKDFSALSKLRLAIEWNRVDIARSHILVEGHKIKQEKLVGKMMLLALKKNRPAFVRLFLEEDLDVRVLLVNEELSWENSDGKEMKVGSGDFEREIKRLLGQDNLTWEQWLKNLVSTNIVGPVGNPHQDQAANKGVSIAQLFQWAVVTNKREMSRVLWENMTDRLPAAVAAVAMLRNLRKQQTTTIKKQEFREHGEDYEKLASGIIAKGYNTNQKKTQSLLMQGYKVWQCDCLRMAVDSYFWEFVSHPAVQDMVDEWWNGDCADPPQSKYTIKPVINSVITFSRKTFVKFGAHVAAYLLFLLLFTYILVFNFHPYRSNEVTSTLITGEAPSLWEWVLFCYIVFHCVDEGYQIYQTSLLEWWHDYWNKMDGMATLPYFVGFALRFFDWNASRTFLSMAFVVFFIRALHFLTVSKLVGPLVVMVGKMIVDLIFVVFLIVIFLFAYGVANQALLYPNENRVDVAIIGIFYKPYWQLYGELFLDEINYDPNSPDKFPCFTNATGNDQRCPEAHELAPALSAVYMILAQILLLNLLIARFSYTFSKYVGNYANIWKYQRFKLVQEYYTKPTLPSVIYCTFRLVSYLHDNCCRDAGGQNKEPEIYMSDFDRWCTDAYLDEKEKEEKSTSASNFQEISESLKALQADFKAFLSLPKPKSSRRPQID